MGILSHEYNGEYELILKASGDGTLRDEDFDADDNSLGIIEDFRNKYFHYPNSISLLIEDGFDYGQNCGYTKIDAGS